MFLGALEDLSTHQLEQLNRLLEAVQRYMPGDDLTEEQLAQRSRIIGQAVSRLRDGMSEAELDEIVRVFKAFSLDSTA